jgi:flagellar motor switch protein FliG
MTADVRKAAILLMSLPEQQAAQLMSKLEPKQVEAVSIEIAKMGTISGDEQETAIQEFAGANPAALAGKAGGLEVARNLVEQALGKAAGATLENVRQSIEALPFGFLQKVDSQNLLTFIIDEHPQTIALILCHLPPAQAADIISGLPAERQMSVIRRVATMGQTSPEIIDEVEKGLEHRMANVMSQQFENAGGVEAVAEILNVIDRATERSLLENLAQEAPDLVEEIRRLMFVFDDVAKLSNRDIQALLKNVESSQWAMALKGGASNRSSSRSWTSYGDWKMPARSRPTPKRRKRSSFSNATGLGPLPADASAANSRPQWPVSCLPSPSCRTNTEPRQVDIRTLLGTMNVVFRRPYHGKSYCREL